MNGPDGWPGGTGFSTSADFDGSGTEELLRAVGLLLGACGSEPALSRLAVELANHVERRDAAVVIDQLAWRVDRLRALHAAARGQAPR